MAILLRLSSEIFIFFVGKARGSSAACLRSSIMSSVSSCLSVKTLHLESRAEFTSKDGFSVVAPIKMMEPFSTKGRNASCWALLNLCISSMKTRVLWPKCLLSSASCITALTSLMPDVTAEKVMNLALDCLAMMFAKVVFPTPGGPQNIIEDICSCSSILLKIFPLPIKCFCPKNSSRFLGLTLTASGWLKLEILSNKVSIYTPQIKSRLMLHKSYI